MINVPLSFHQAWYFYFWAINHDEEKALKRINEEKEIKEEIENIQEKKEEEKNIVESQQKLVEINFIGKTEDKILNLLGQPWRI